MSSDSAGEIRKHFYLSSYIRVYICTDACMCVEAGGASDCTLISLTRLMRGLLPSCPRIYLCGMMLEHGDNSARLLAESGDVLWPARLLEESGNVLLEERGDVLWLARLLEESGDVLWPARLLEESGDVLWPARLLEESGDVLWPARLLEESWDVLWPARLLEESGNVLWPARLLRGEWGLSMTWLAPVPLTPVMPEKSRNVGTGAKT
jgi:hypothetical protein